MASRKKILFARIYCLLIQLDDSFSLRGYCLLEKVTYYGMLHQAHWVALACVAISLPSMPFTHFRKGFVITVYGTYLEGGAANMKERAEAYRQKRGLHHKSAIQY